MKILSIDTSSKICSVSILEDTDLIIEKHIDNELTHSQKLMPLIDEILKINKLNLSDFDLFACSTRTTVLLQVLELEFLQLKHLMMLQI